jgi:Na+-translocating ferredoxin:NAD+ oxidoreductase RNF subunit RnfB
MDNNGLNNVLANTGRHQHLLQLGHKLAAACDKIVEACPKNLSQRIEQMEDVLVHYRRIVAVINFEMDRGGIDANK